VTREGATRTLMRAAAVELLVLAATAAPAQWQIESKDGNASLKLGFLAQPQAEWLDTVDASRTSQNFFLRRFRIIFSGKVAERWDFFFETDSPNLGRVNPDKAANPAGEKDASSIYVQDAFITYNHGPAFKLDVGLLLVPESRNHTQSAASLLPVDYGPYTFSEGGATGERAGRDYGVQARGYPLKQHLEYRVCVCAGRRGAEAANAPRFTGRVAYYPWAADAGFFYTGTFQGTKKVLSLGASLDVQKAYAAYAADVFYEQPLRAGSRGLTVQFNWERIDGGGFIPSLPKQDRYLFEAGFHLGKGRVSPFVQYAIRSFDDPANADQSSLHAGLAWWMKGHKRNLKLSAGRLRSERQPDRTQALAQLQIFYN
jgi:hypothetical protein